MDEKTLNDLLECAICLDRLDIQSKVLPCQHTFCRRCLEEIVSSKHELRCPECRILVNSTIDDLPPNVLLMRILGGLKTTDITNDSTSVQPAATTSVVQKPAVNERRSVALNTSATTASPTTPPQQILPPASNHGSVHPHKYLPQNVCHAKALFDFESHINGDLAFKKGDVIALRRRIDQNWFYGHLNGREGAFPVNHVQIIVPLPVPQCTAIYDFRMGPNEEEGCLLFKKGQIINVVRRVDQNWAEGRIGECIGIFPINFVEMNPLGKQMMMDFERMTSITTATVPNLNRELPPAPNTPSAAVAGSSPITPQPNTQSIVRRASTSVVPYQVDNRKSVPGPLTNAGQCVQGITDNTSNRTANFRHSAEILNPSSSNNHNNSSRSPLGRAAEQSGIGLMNHTISPCVCIAMYPYKPQKSDELELIKGGHYYVTERCQDGWLKGMNKMQKSGVFPGNYVSPMKTIGRHDEVPFNAATSVRPVHTISATPPTLPPRNPNLENLMLVQAPGASGLEMGRSEKKDSPQNLIQRSSNISAIKSTPSSSYSLDNPVFEDIAISSAAVPTPKSSQPQVHLSHPIHIRSGSCPSQLQQLQVNVAEGRSGEESAIRKQCMANMGRNGPTQTQYRQIALAYGSQRMRAPKERPALHNMHRQLGERQEDLTSLSSKSNSNHHGKSHSLDGGKLIGDGIKEAGSSRCGSGSNSSHHSQGSSIKERYRCIVAYPPNSEYELELNVGDVIVVNKKRENGWYRGTHQRTGKVGLFPASFVESFP